MSLLTPSAKHQILLEYIPRSATHSFEALARRHAIAGGERTIRRWYSSESWDGTPHSLNPKPRSGRPRILTAQQVEQHIATPIREANRNHKAIHYTSIAESVKEATGKSPSLRTLQNYGKKELKAKQKRTKKRRLDELSKEMCEAIAGVRRKLRRVKDGHVVILDETHLRLNEAPTNTIVLSGEQQYVIVDETTSYAPRYDMIACCTSKETLPPMIWAPSERRKGINKQMLLDYIRDFLAQSLGALDRYPLYLMIDGATIHNEKEMLEAFHESGCQELVEIIKLPAMSAKRVSPLDNSIFHDWKQAIRKHGRITKDNIRQLMHNEWANIPPRVLDAHFRQCLLKPRQSNYGDCPSPDKHKHETSETTQN